MISGNIRVFGNAIALVTLRGQLVLGDGTQSFRNVMQGLLRENYRYIVIDLRDVERIDCAGLGELGKCHSQGRDVGTIIALQHLPRRVQNLLVITRLVALFGWPEVDSRLAA